MTLKELYEANIDVRDSQIPNDWKESFNQFIFGQGCYMLDKLDLSGEKEFVYYACDFRAWYFQNQKSIERDIKIDLID
jgi:hypothetical protein